MHMHPRDRRRRTLMTVPLLLMSMVAAVAAGPQGQSLRFVSTVWSPFTNVTGQPRIALDLVEAALKRIGVTSTTSMVEPSAFTTTLLNGPADGTASAWKDSQREKVLLYSEPYLENRLIVVGRRGSDVNALSLAELKGKRIAIVAGYAYGDDIDKTGPTFVRTGSEEDSVRRLLASDVDYALIDELVVKSIFERYPEQAEARLQVGAASMLRRPLHLAIRRTVPNAASIVERFNAQLRTMIADRTYHKLLNMHWISADVDGDGITESIPDTDQIGAAEPKTPYVLISDGKQTPELKKAPQRFYLGGNIYESWAAVPTPYKTNNQDPDYRRSTGSVFTFGW